MQVRSTTCLFSRILRYRSAHTLRGHQEDPRWPGWGVVIGIEVHAQIKSKEKLFSDEFNGSRTPKPTDLPNTLVSAYDAAFPGTLPHLNPKCVELGVRTALALNAKVQSRSAFDRKHYFYPDLPSGYQITQHYAPFATGGYLPLGKGETVVRIHQIQLEQDTGKSTTDTRRRTWSIDLNRAGVGLMEIVSEPDMRSPEEAGDYVRTLQALLRSVGSSDGNMEQGSLRCDVNVSVNRPGDPFGTRCEIKNLNSVKFMMVAISGIACEVFRQIKLLTSGQLVPQETRGFNEDMAETFGLRSKEDAPDYRYMPDPNLPPLLLTDSYVNNIRHRMPELPHVTKARLLAKGLSERDVDVLMAIDMGKEVGYDGELGQGAVAYFDTISQNRDPKVVVNWITHELLGQLAVRQETFKDNILSTHQLGELIDLVQDGKMTGTSGKTVLRYILTNRSHDMPSTLASKLSLFSLPENGDELERWCLNAIEALPSQAAAARKGNMNVLNRLLGHVMKASRGRADAKAARDSLQQLLNKPNQ